MPDLLETHAFRALGHFDGLRELLRPAERLVQARRRAAALREELLAGPWVLGYRSLPLVRVPYPSRYGFWRAGRGLPPLMHILNRMFVIRFRGWDGQARTLVVSPSDAEANKETPFFKRLAGRARLLGPFGERLLAPVLGTVEGHLAALGIRPEEVDYLAYDHLHTQDVRRWLGSRGAPGWFPRAKLLVTPQEWEAAQAPLPLNASWYVPFGVDGVDPERLIPVERDLHLGEGLAIVRTPGHTEGNMSFVAHTPDGLLVTSENGVSADNYAPERSRIRGLRAWAREVGAEVVLNGNTLERTNDQYLSMIVEKELAGPARRQPEFFNVVPSSELSAYWAFPGVAPSFSFGELSFGALGAS